MFVRNHPRVVVMWGVRLLTLVNLMVVVIVETDIVYIHRMLCH